MSDIAIRVEGLSKAYRIGLKEQQHETMLGALATWVKSPLKSFRDLRKLSSFEDISTNSQPSTLNSQPSDVIWALKDISFEVKHGEVVGIIGPNGAGKSTLLKILARITEPTRGRAEIHGRVGSLLEVGTGFHPDLTGRENVYLNGTILGMKKREVDARFDEIVEFSGVEKFIDTPVKRYSSGMRVRLAFAVAAHLEPEILIVDEVLAVGDAEFQKKCLGKMQDVASQGRTVLFVSHNMSAVQGLCATCALLRKGGLVEIGPTPGVVDYYLRDNSSTNRFQRNRPVDGPVKVVYAEVTGKRPGSSQKIELTVRLCSDGERQCTLDLRMCDFKGQPVAFGSLGTLHPANLLYLHRGQNDIAVSIPIQDLAVGSYYLSMDVTHPDAEYYDRVEQCLTFDVARAPKEGAIRVLDQKWGYGCMELHLEGGPLPHQ